MNHYLIWLLVPLCALVWRLGGGAFTTLTGLNYGTDPARALRAAPAAILCLPFGWRADLAPMALFLGIGIAGWGPFQGMGLTYPGRPLEKSWLQWLPRVLGLQLGTVAHDFVGMLESGLLCMLPIFAVMTWAAHRPEWLLLAAAGGFAPAYLLARLGWPTIPRFATRQEWGEIFVGALIGVALVLSC